MEEVDASGETREADSSLDCLLNGFALDVEEADCLTLGKPCDGHVLGSGIGERLDGDGGLVFGWDDGRCRRAIVVEEDLLGVGDGAREEDVVILGVVDNGDVVVGELDASDGGECFDVVGAFELDDMDVVSPVGKGRGKERDEREER